MYCLTFAVGADVDRLIDTKLDDVENAWSVGLGLMNLRVLETTFVTSASERA